MGLSEKELVNSNLPNYTGIADLPDIQSVQDIKRTAWHSTCSNCFFFESKYEEPERHNEAQGLRVCNASNAFS